ncbi:hypothetical protein [Streptomyces chartreusis]
MVVSLGHQDVLRDAFADDKPLPKAAEPEETGAKVLDLMTALNESVAKAQAARGAGPADVHEMPKKKTTTFSRDSRALYFEVSAGAAREYATDDCTLRCAHDLAVSLCVAHAIFFDFPCLSGLPNTGCGARQGSLKL